VTPVPRPFGLTVVIPHFDRPQLLRRAVDSVRTRSETPVEVIVVDDASPSDPRSVFGPTNAHGVPMRHYRLPRNSGPQTARNLGIRRAAYRFIAFLDSDDIFLPEKIDAVIPHLQDDSVDLLFHDAEGMEVSSRISRLWHRHGSWLPLRCLLALVNPIATPTLVVRRRHVLGVPGMRHTEDWAYLIRYCEGQTRVRYLPQTLTSVQRPQGSKGGLSQARWRMRRGEFAAHRLLLRRLRPNNMALAMLGAAVSVLRVGSDLLRGRIWPTRGAP
jgi:teichuronic acid biosynthesis glycosyltransferase TuaG